MSDFDKYMLFLASPFILMVCALIYANYTNMVKGGRSRAFAILYIAGPLLVLYLLAAILAATEFGKKLIAWMFVNALSLVYPIMPFISESDHDRLNTSVKFEGWPTGGQVAYVVFGACVVCMLTVAALELFAGYKKHIHSGGKHE